MLIRYPGFDLVVLEKTDVNFPPPNPSQGEIFPLAWSGGGNSLLNKFPQELY